VIKGDLVIKAKRHLPPPKKKGFEILFGDEATSKQGEKLNLV